MVGTYVQGEIRCQVRRTRQTGTTIDARAGRHEVRGIGGTGAQVNRQAISSRSGSFVSHGDSVKLFNIWEVNFVPISGSKRIDTIKMFIINHQLETFITLTDTAGLFIVFLFRHYKYVFSAFQFPISAKRQ